MSFEVINLVCSYAWSAVSGDHIDFVRAVGSIVLCINTGKYPGICSRLWFLPCMFVASISMWFIRKYVGNSKAKMIIAAIQFFVTFVLSKIYGGRLPFTLDIAIIAVGFMLIGYVSGKYIEYLLKSSICGIKNITITIILAVTYCLCLKVNPEPFYMYINNYGKYFYAMFGAIAGSFLFLILGNNIYIFVSKYNIQTVGKFVNWYGLNSLLVFPVHLEILFLVHILNGHFLGGSWVIAFVLTSIITIPVCNFVTKRMPFLAGKYDN